ncbi:hypothetical protein AWZ03_011870 [Drosophila navojoa]|uniref:Secreted protein n=1 Tax=Drosophila navojoa TaxID=7232 RepID=A0A484AYN7_DRONA|nr:hypothetical protein AWZ03_011870 [Drosophila navojoa]
MCGVFRLVLSANLSCCFGLLLQQQQQEALMLQEEGHTGGQRTLADEYLNCTNCLTRRPHQHQLQQQQQQQQQNQKPVQL